MEWKDIYYKYITNNWNWSRGRVKQKRGGGERERERAEGKVSDSVYISNPKGQKEAKVKSEGKLTALKLKNLKGCIDADLSKRKDRESNSNGCEISWGGRGKNEKGDKEARERERALDKTDGGAVWFRGNVWERVKYRYGGIV